MAQKICLQCGSVGNTKGFMKGSVLTELFLWLFFILPGLIYSIWRHSTVAQVCSKCGSSNVIPLDSPVARNLLATQPQANLTGVTPPAPPAQDTRMSPKTAVLVVGACAVLVLVIMVSLNSTSEKPAEANAPPIATPAVAQVSTTPRVATKTTGNEANDRMLALPKGEQASMLGKVTGEDCVGNRAFYLGISKERNAFWSVGCMNGNSYEVEIDADSVGSTTILECSMLKAVAHVDCFKKFTSQ
ncbi:MAG: hypothetical protein WA757_18850 [Candidatus Acidiferrales bacterium]